MNIPASKTAKANQDLREAGANEEELKVEVMLRA